MLTEIVIHDFAIIERLQLLLEPGLNVLTGETGSGKSMVIDALSFVLGARGGASQIRAQARSARVEATFIDVSDALLELLDGAGVPMEDRTVVLFRETTSGGRNTYRINGHMVTPAVLRAVGDLLVEIHGQHDAHALLSAPRHLDLLDRLGGAALLEQRAQVASAWKEWKSLRDERAALESAARERERRREWLTFEVGEIEALELREEPDEIEALEAERAVLTNADKIRARADEARVMLDGGDGDVGARDALGRVARVLVQLASLDPATSAMAASAAALVDGVDELTRDLSRYGDGVEADPHRLDRVNERLDAIHRLQKKYGSSVREILAYGRRARAQLEEIELSQERGEALDLEIARAGACLATAASALSSLRKTAAAELESEVARELAGLEMPAARFAVRFDQSPDDEGLEVAQVGEGRVRVGATGADGVEFLISANPGQPPQPVARIASGGETSRVMLAMQSVLARVNPVPTLIFDEVDAGLGGMAAEAVAARLRAIAQRVRGRQVVCITHLPLVAAAATSHWSLRKAVSDGVTHASAHRLDMSERTREIARMMAGKQASETTLRQAEEMLACRCELPPAAAGAGRTRKGAGKPVPSSSSA